MSGSGRAPAAVHDALLRALAARPGGTWVTCAGSSMEPAIRRGDRVCIEACAAVRSGEVALFAARRGGYVLQRVVLVVPGTGWFVHVGDRGTVSRQKQLDILHRMADIDLSRLDWLGALRVYSQVRKLDPDDEKARRESVDLNLRLGQEEQAARELDGYLEFLVQNGRGTEALALLEEMAREHPGKQALHARLAEAYRAAGRSADAIAQYDALGEIQLDAGSVREAARTIQIIISLNPPDVEGYKELLRNLEAGQ